MNEPDTKNWAELAALFDEISELDTGERALRMQQLREQQPALASRVQALLVADAAASGLLERSLDKVAPALHESLRSADWESYAGLVIGRYRLIESIGSGGMGEVWRAERADGEYRQSVAVKLLKRGMDTQAILRRFLQERSILARLQHPGIVRLIDGGMSSDGRPYFVMECVLGASVTDFAAAARLDVRARVALVATIADAVSYAHAQLVVHRDLKPSNVIVDGDGAPHLLDFGIAKLLETSGAQTMTGTGIRVLSPAYAAPEQILGEAVGTATDVYALGVLLYELLTGELPHRRLSRDPGVLAVELGKESIERPSHVLARSDRSIALYGHTDRKRLSRELIGDLDLILGTAMHREPPRRYATMAAYADDLRRWLDGRPITARADSTRYRLGKFVRRHRLGVAAAILVLVALLGGLGIVLWQAGVARSEAHRADTERDLARQQLARAERVKEFVLALFREQDPISRAKVQARSAPELIREGIAQVDATLATDPALQAGLLRDLGEIQASLGEREAGKATLQRAWEMQTTLTGPDSAATADALAAYAKAALFASDTSNAEPMARQAILKLTAAYGAEHAKTAEAEATLARIEMARGRYAEALALAEHALKVGVATWGSEDARVAPSLHLVGVIQAMLSNYDESMATVREALRIVEKHSGPDHVRTITLHSQLSDVLRNQRNFDESLLHLDTALRIARANLPPRHPLLGGLLTRQGDQLRRMQRYAEAESVFAEAASILEGTQSVEAAQMMQLYATLALAQGHRTDAVERYRKSVEMFRNSTGDSTYTWLTTLLLVEAVAGTGQLDEAARIGEEAAAAIARLSPPDSYDSAFSAAMIGRLRYRQGRADEAIELQRHALGIIAPSYGDEHVETADARVMLARSLVAGKRLVDRAEAAALLERALPIVENADNKRALLAELYLARANLQLDAGDPAKANEDLSRAERTLSVDASERQEQQQRAQHLRKRIGSRPA